MIWISIRDLLWDWSHVRDSSDEAFIAMATEIKQVEFREERFLMIQCLILRFLSQIIFKVFVAEFDYYTIYEPDAVSEIDRIDDELYHETRV